MQQPIILASQSPTRTHLLHMIGLAHEVIPANINEVMNPKEEPEAFAARMSLEKAQAVSALHPGRTIIAADSVVVAATAQVFGKPKDKRDALHMLQTLAGQRHIVHTGVTVIIGEETKTEVVTTYVWFRAMSEKEIDTYIECEKPYDKAGAYGIQGPAAVFVKKIEGDYYNVMGLPLCTLHEMLQS